MKTIDDMAVMFNRKSCLDYSTLTYRLYAFKNYILIKACCTFSDPEPKPQLAPVKAMPGADSPMRLPSRKHGRVASNDSDNDSNHDPLAVESKLLSNDNDG